MGPLPGRAIQEPIKTKRGNHRANSAKRAGMGTATSCAQTRVLERVQPGLIVLQVNPRAAPAISESTAERVQNRVRTARSTRQRWAKVQGNACAILALSWRTERAGTVPT